MNDTGVIYRFPDQYPFLPADPLPQIDLWVNRAIPDLIPSIAQREGAFGSKARTQAQR